MGCGQSSAAEPTVLASGVVDPLKVDTVVPDDAPGDKIIAMDQRLAACVVTGESKLKALFEGLDRDENGRVSAKEWSWGVATNPEMMSKYFGGATKAEIASQFRRLDTSGSGDLTWEEFESGALSLGTALTLAAALDTVDGHAELKRLFESIDKNADGRVSSKEWGSAVSVHEEQLRKFFGGATLADIGQAFTRLDADASKDLTWDEFVSGATALTSSAALEATFSLIDRNNDGAISRIEVIKALRTEPTVRKMLGLGAIVRQEDGTRDAFEEAFQAMDANSDKQISFKEFCAHLGPAVRKRDADEAAQKKALGQPLALKA